MALPPPAPGSAALVTGASSGIGEQFARALAARGHDLVLVARRADRLERLAAELAVRAEPVPCDLADAAARDGLATRVDELGLAVEVLVNAAGFGLYGRFGAHGRAREVEQVRLDVEAVVDLCARFAGPMAERGRGTIVNVGSTAGYQPLPFNAGYAASKGFVLLLSEALHAELAEHGVTVTCLSPGPVPTEFQDVNDARFAERLPRAAWATPERCAADALAAADAGRRNVVPGGLALRAAFAPNRLLPSALTLPVTRRLMRR